MRVNDVLNKADHGIGLFVVVAAAVGAAAAVGDLLCL